MKKEDSFWVLENIQALSTTTYLGGNILDNIFESTDNIYKSLHFDNQNEAQEFARAFMLPCYWQPREHGWM